VIGLLSATKDIRFKFLRAKVVDNIDKKKYGRVKVYIPELMYDLPDTTTGIWAYPANTSYGGSNTKMKEFENESGSLYVPTKGQWLWVFFEDTNPNRPYYIASLYIANKKVPPETRQGDEWWNKWLILRSPDGRSMWISDDPADAGIYITGKKRVRQSDSVFQIKDNQTIIQIDDRASKEKILVADFIGNYILVNTNNSKMYMYMSSVKGTGQIDIYTNQGLIVIDDSGYIKVQVPSTVIELNNGVLKLTSNSVIHIKSSGPINLDGSTINMNCGMSQSAQPNQKPDIDINSLMPEYKES